MKRIWRIVRWVLAGTAALVVIAVAAGVIITRTARFNDFVRARLVSYLNQSYRGEITIGSIQGSVWGSLTLRDITIVHGNSKIGVIPELRVGYYLLPALHGRIVLSDIDVIQPRFWLARQSDGQWNLLAALAERNPTPPTDIAVVLRRIGVQQADISVTTAPATTYRISDGNLGAAGNLDPAGVSFDANKIAFALSGPGLVPIQAQGAAQYREAAQVATIKVPGFSIRTARSQVEMHGTLSDLSVKNVTATITAGKLAAADINTIVPGADLARDISGNARISGKASDLRAVVAIAAGDSHVNAAIHADLAKAKPIWGIDAKLAKLDLRKLFKAPRAPTMPGGEISAVVQANAVGTSLPSVNGTIRAQVAGLSASGLRMGDVALDTRVSRQVANLDAKLNSAGGRAQLSGRVDIAKTPSYKLALTVDHLRPARVASASNIPPADLSLTATIEGAGYQPDTMNTRAQVRWLPSTVEGVRINSGHLDAQIARGVVQIASASLKAGATTADVHGMIAIDQRRSGRLTYKVIVGQAANWLAMAGRRGSGRAEIAGQAEGSLHNLRATGSAELSTVTVDSYAVEHARLTYDVAGLGAPLKPEGRLMLTATGLKAGVALKSLQTNVRLTPGAALAAAIDLTAEDRFSHPASLRAQVAYTPKRTVVSLTEAAVGTNHGTWRMPQPAQLVLHGKALEVSRLRFANGSQSVAIEGTVSPAGAQDLTARLKGLRIADFASYLPRPVEIAGVASADLTVRGVAAAPIISLTADVAGLKTAQITYAGLSARFTYQDGRAHGEATLAQDASHSLRVTAALPVSLGWARGFQARPTGDIDLRAVSSGLDLAFLNAIANPQLTGIGGTLSLDLSARGPIHHPLPQGYIRLSAVHATNRRLGVEVTGVSAQMQLQPGELRLVSLSASAGEGTMRGSGALTLLESGRPDRLDLRVSFDKWPAAATHEMRAAVAGNVKVDGPLTALNVDGQVDVLWGIFRPALSVLGGPRPDHTVTVVDKWSANQQERFAPPPPPPSAPGPTFNNLAMNLEIVVHRNTWIKTADFAVELEGNINVRKKRGKAVNLSGVINSVRGTLVVAQREFDLKRGHITFTGGHEINPELDIVAQRRVQSYLVLATVGGNAKKPTLTLSSIPDLPQADILSVMMFGKPTSQLSGNQQKDLQNEAISMAGGYAATQVGQAVAEALGLSSLGVSVGGSSGLGFGRYLTENVYVSASQSTSNMQNRKAQADYYVTPNVSLSTSASTNSGNEIRLDWHKEY